VESATDKSLPDFANSIHSISWSMGIYALSTGLSIDIMEAMPCSRRGSWVSRAIRGESQYLRTIESSYAPFRISRSNKFFQGVVRDLWALRLRGFSTRINETSDEDDDEPQIFSSQATPAESENGSADESGFRPESHFLQWPRLLDSVGICYLAAVLMRLPLCVVDVHRYVPYQLIARFASVVG
jgi:hypothetical protein